MYGGTVVDASLIAEPKSTKNKTGERDPEIKDDEVLSQIEFRINKRPSSLKMANDFKDINWDKKMSMASRLCVVK